MNAGMSERPRHLTHVVRRLPQKPRGPGGPGWRGPLAVGLLALLASIIVAVAAPGPAQPAGAVMVSLSGSPPSALPGLTPGAPSGAAASPAPDNPEPTSTFLPPSPTPTRLRAAAPTVRYVTSSGDSLASIAAHFGVNPQDIGLPPGFHNTTTLDPGQTLRVPDVFAPTGLGPADHLLPDSEVIFSAAAGGFDPQAFAREQGGYLARYSGFADGQTRSGGDVILSVARRQSINPRLLVALLEQQGGWVSQAKPSAAALSQPMGYPRSWPEALTPQVNWAANQLGIGYYGWRSGTLTTLTLADGSQVRIHPGQNAGSVAVQHLFAQLYGRAEWEAALAEFPAVYRRLFGDPWERELSTLIPGDLTQPPMELPFLRGTTWYFSGGPHGAWEAGGSQAALDFAPGSVEGGCAPSDAWVTAAAAGVIARSEHNAVVLDLDGDGRETTGWVVFYYHVAERDRIEAGTVVEAGDMLGHPSCEGGRATGTHLHLARKYNGEWIAADSAVPFNLEGWVARAGPGEYLGSLEKDGQVVKACACAAHWTALTAGR